MYILLVIYYCISFFLSFFLSSFVGVVLPMHHSGCSMEGLENPKTGRGKLDIFNYCYSWSSAMHTIFFWLIAAPNPNPDVM